LGSNKRGFLTSAAVKTKGEERNVISLLVGLKVFILAFVVEVLIG
jgi:hypothetical protein